MCSNPTRVCTRCKQTLPLSNFRHRHDGKNFRGYYERCRECEANFPAVSPVFKLREPVDQGDGTFAVPLTRGKVAIVDAEDVALVAAYQWQAKPNRGNWYARTTINVDGRRVSVGMHRLLIQPRRGYVPDHIDGDGLNNRRSNLREATYSQNRKNRRPKREPDESLAALAQEGAAE